MNLPSGITNANKVRRNTVALILVVTISSGILEPDRGGRSLGGRRTGELVGDSVYSP
jgi:hypothetical protein